MQNKENININNTIRPVSAKTHKDNNIINNTNLWDIMKNRSKNN
jgi:hypothetical protein